MTLADGVTVERDPERPDRTVARRPCGCWQAYVVRWNTIVGDGFKLCPEHLAAAQVKLGGQP